MPKSTWTKQIRRKQSLPAASIPWSTPQHLLVDLARMPDRGMSPGSEGEWEEDCDPSPSGSGCSSSESSHGWNWKRTPVAAVRRGKRGGRGKSVSGEGESKPALNHKGRLPPDEEGRVIRSSTRDIAVSQLKAIREDIVSSKAKFEDVASRLSDCSSTKRGMEIEIQYSTGRRVKLELFAEPIWLKQQNFAAYY
ncbi:hypothetical protein Tsubulata_001672 [Turnera subulata]|uniref:Peptidyl-prolyl cis-trans isomerase n=1 Tax=Turnera subulata TaxID=218843 RepID=A0A9Q0FUH6_9ROSI|nr:hypothetical protein Tsubulata_001672 [Turnera subulata]